MKSKSGDPMVLSLTDETLKVLESRRSAVPPECPWVFPGRGATGHITEIKSTWKRILERAGIRDLRLHDLRRTLGSWQAATGASLPIIGKTLGHRNQATTAIYARLDLNPVRKSLEIATRAMLTAAGEQPAEPKQIGRGKTGQGKN
jgi:integrase